MLQRQSEMCCFAVTQLLMLGKSIISSANNAQDPDSDKETEKINWPEDSVEKAKVIMMKAQTMTGNVEAVSNSFVTGIFAWIHSVLPNFHSSASSWHTSINEENEFLRVQNQSELDSLRKKLDLCVKEKEKQHRYVNDLNGSREIFKSSHDSRDTEEIELPSVNNCQMPSIAASDQMELKTMVDATVSASQREAEAHETAIFLSKENDEVKMKLKVLLEDNSKLIELSALFDTNCLVIDF